MDFDLVPQHGFCCSMFHIYSDVFLSRSFLLLFWVLFMNVPNIVLGCSNWFAMSLVADDWLVVTAFVQSLCLCGFQKHLLLCVEIYAVFYLTEAVWLLHFYGFSDFLLDVSSLIFDYSFCLLKCHVIYWIVEVYTLIYSDIYLWAEFLTV